MGSAIRQNQITPLPFWASIPSFASPTPQKWGERVFRGWPKMESAEFSPLLPMYCTALTFCGLLFEEELRNVHSCKLFFLIHKWWEEEEFWVGGGWDKWASDEVWTYQVEKRVKVYFPFIYLSKKGIFLCKCTIP